ncbi:hypothetical protein CYY_010586 [Polysphondylium violaceum]|uniref:Uncharacterized protein n=1 Tax=Polysphondylium violaceum TaxID=133409 RepID=A0A8J4PJZ2_9MYCE|nr:hypothetical protein CYY_010586 [Polysphondylium violaceum]
MKIVKSLLVIVLLIALVKSEEVPTAVTSIWNQDGISSADADQGVCKNVKISFTLDHPAPDVSQLSLTSIGLDSFIAIKVNGSQYDTLVTAKQGSNLNDLQVKYADKALGNIASGFTFSCTTGEATDTPNIASVVTSTTTDAPMADGFCKTILSITLDKVVDPGTLSAKSSGFPDLFVPQFVQNSTNPPSYASNITVSKGKDLSDIVFYQTTNKLSYETDAKTSTYSCSSIVAETSPTTAGVTPSPTTTGEATTGTTTGDSSVLSRNFTLTVLCFIFVSFIF